MFGSTKVAAKGGASALLASVSSSSPSAKSSRLEFVVTFYPIGDGSSPVVVRRSFTDMMWLNETFALHKKPGGTLCGRILPPFPCASRSAESSDEGKSSITGSVVAAGSSAAVAAATIRWLANLRQPRQLRQLSTRWTCQYRQLRQLYGAFRDS